MHTLAAVRSLIQTQFLPAVGPQIWPWTRSQQRHLRITWTYGGISFPSDANIIIDGDPASGCLQDSRWLEQPWTSTQIAIAMSEPWTQTWPLAGDITLAPGAKQAIYVSWFLVALDSSDMPLSPAFTPFSPSLPFSHHSLIIMVSKYLAPQAPEEGLLISQRNPFLWIMTTKLF